MTIDDGTLPGQIDPEVRDQIMRIKHGNGRTQSPDHTPDKQVTPDACAIMREMHDRGMNKQEIAAAVDWVSYNTVLHHVNEDCTCDHRTHVHYDDCMKMRIRAKRGIPAGLIGLFHGVGVDAVYAHLSGRCSHDDGIEPLSTGNGGAAYTEAAGD